MSDTHRDVEIERIGDGGYLARNVRGGELRFGTQDESDFSPVELLMVAIAGCAAVDIEVVTSRRAEPTRFVARVDAEKVKEPEGSILRELAVTFDVRFPEGEAGDAARAVLPRALQISHDRSCTVSRTVEAASPIAMRLAELD
ncbi:OsmC family protein [Actinotalea sp.]|uniref:OsmC family protein n=1 Tax=Actinotalea sp. TaxID=1872145 RepID=UPI0035660C9D